MPNATLEARYEALKSKREPFLMRAREYAALTIPALMPPQGFNSTLRLPEPYQGFGGRATVALSSRLLVTFLPIGQPFFRLRVPSKTLITSGTMSPPPDVEQGFALSEQLIQSEVERRQWRHPTSLTLQLLIVTGNALEQMLPDNRIRTFRLDQYVVLRDHAGNLLEIVIEEKLSPDSLPVAAQGLVPARKGTEAATDVSLFTGYKRLPNGSFRSWQEVNGKSVPKSAGTYANEAILPVWPLRWAILPGHDYGRAKIEEHIGDLRALEGYRKSLIEGAAMASRHITLVRPNAAGGNLRQRIAKAKNGDVLSGNVDDVNMLQFQNIAGLQIVQAEVQQLLPQLASSFMLVSDMRRDAERVTAQELRMLANEVESTQGGAYSLLSDDMQRKRLSRLIYQMQRQQQLPPWTGDMVDPQITTGLEALGRAEEVQKVMTAGSILQGLGETAQSYVKWNVLLKTAFNGIGLANAVKTDQEVAQEQQQAAQLQAMQQGLGTALGAAGQAAAQGTPQ